MQLTTTKTDYIIVKADAYDEWTFANCAIIHIGGELERMKTARDTFNTVKSVTDIYGLSFWNNAPTFLNLDEDTHEWIATLKEELQWSYIDITEEEMIALAETEQYLRTELGLLIVQDSDSFLFKAYQKNSGISMSTRHLKFLDFI